jgi:hypothetical protein
VQQLEDRNHMVLLDDPTLLCVMHVVLHYGAFVHVAAYLKVHSSCWAALLLAHCI